MNKKYFITTGLYIALSILIINIGFEFISPYLSDKIINLRTVCTGFISGFISVVIVKIMNKKVYKENPKLEKEAKIQESDERNIYIRKTAGHYMSNVTIFLLIGMTFIFVIIDSEVAMMVSLLAIIVYITLYLVVLLRLNKKL